MTLDKIINSGQVTIEHAQALTSGYGHKKIEVEVVYWGEGSNWGIGKTFTAVTDNMPAYDQANELEGENKYEALFEIIEHKIEDEVMEWIEIN